MWSFLTSEKQSSNGSVSKACQSVCVTSCPAAQMQSQTPLKGSHWEEELGCLGNPPGCCKNSWNGGFWHRNKTNSQQIFFASHKWFIRALIWLFSGPADSLGVLFYFILFWTRETSVNRRPQCVNLDSRVNGALKPSPLPQTVRQVCVFPESLKHRYRLYKDRSYTY